MKLEDEFEMNDLKAFAFTCIESLAKLPANGSKQSVEQVLTGLVKEKLAHFVNLVNEYLLAQQDFEEYSGWSKEFVSSVQPLINAESAPAEEVGQLTSQALQCVERSMCTQYKVTALQSRVDFLIESVPAYVGSTGEELGLPSHVMQKLAASVNQALTRVANL